MNPLSEYIAKLLEPCGGELGKIQKEAYEKGLPIIPKDTEKLLEFVLSVKRPERILEIGACIGFSSSLMSGFIPKSGHITTIDRYDVMIKQAKENYRKLGVEDKITLIESDALTALKELCKNKESYDFIFIDAAKGQYINFLPYCLDMLNVGGIMAADDIFTGGTVAEERYAIPRRQRTAQKRMREFLYQICRNKSLKTALLNVGGGVALCHKISETNGLVPYEEELSESERLLEKLMNEKEELTADEINSVPEIFNRLSYSQRKTAKEKLERQKERKHYEQ